MCCVCVGVNTSANVNSNVSANDQNRIAVSRADFGVIERRLRLRRQAGILCNSSHHICVAYR